MAVITQNDTGRAGGQRTVTVFGGTGFLGRRIVQHLLARGFLVRAASRHPESVPPLFRTELPNLTALGADIHREDEVAAAIAGATAVVNAVSLYVERGGDTFHSVHVDAAGHLAHLCREAEVERYVHISGIGADPSSSSAYIRARGEGEAAVRESFPNAILIRPAVMFGLDDAFLTTLIKLLKKLPIYPMFGTGRTRLQPAYVEDVGEAVARLLDGSESQGGIFELGGPRVYTYEELLRDIAQQIGVRRRLISMPFPLWRILAAVSEHLPVAGLTRNQVELMEHDNVASGQLPGFDSLGIRPTSIEQTIAELETDGVNARRREPK
jgi:NADH dehydrogenase